MNAPGYGTPPRVGTASLLVYTGLTDTLLGTIADRLVLADAAARPAEGTPVTHQLFAIGAGVVIGRLIEDKV